MARNNRRKHGRVRDSQVRDTVHSQVRINNAAVLERCHARRASRMVQRLHIVSAVLLDLSVGRVAEPVLQLRVDVPHRIDHRRNGIGTRYPVQKLDTTREDFNVVVIGEVSAKR